MKRSSLAPSVLAIVLFVAAFFVVTTSAQAPAAAPGQAQQGPPPGGGRGGGGRNAAPPTNLQVLPKDFTGQQVRDVMRTWAGSLGVECETCHATDPSKVGPNGQPQTNFALDAKPQKATARLMYTMMKGINDNTISMVADKDGNKAAPVTCGTCHRGHLDPEAFVLPARGGPGGPGGRGGPGGPPPAGAAPPPPPAN